MSQLANASTARPDVTAEPEPPPVGVSAVPVLITQHEVAFGAAAAAPMYPTTRWWVTATRSIAAALRRRHYPPRRRYLEDAAMAREMHRL